MKLKFYNRDEILYLKYNNKGLSLKMEYNQINIDYVLSLPKDNKLFKKFNVVSDSKNVIELCEIVLEEKSSYLKNTTLKSYHSVFEKWIKPYFDINVCLVDSFHIYEWYKKFKSTGTITVCEAILKDAFQIAIIRGWIKTSPFQLKKPKLKSEYEIKPFSLEEINLILSNTNGWFKNLLGLAFFSGMRIGEMLALTWNNINFEDYTINIDKTHTNGFIQSPKTRSSIRIIDMLPQAENYLKNQKRINGLSNYVFLSNGRKISSSSYLFPMWKKLITSLVLDYRNIYQTRHTFASQMLSNKESLQWVSQMLGHKDTIMCQKVYYKYIPRTRTQRKTTFLDDTQLAQKTI